MAKTPRAGYESNKKGKSKFNLLGQTNSLNEKNKNARPKSDYDYDKVIFSKISNNSDVNRDKLQILIKILNYLLKKPVELELVRLYKPFSESKILVKLLALIMNKIKLNKIKKRVLKGTFSKTPNKWKTAGESNTEALSLQRMNTVRASNRTNARPLGRGRNKIFSFDPSYLSGIRIKIGGRLLTQRVVPRKTVKIIHKGILARSKVIYNDTARFTNKNKRGAYSITVSITNITAKTQIFAHTNAIDL